MWNVKGVTMLRRKDPSRSIEDKVVSVVSTVLITIYAAVCLFPFLYVVFVSFMPYQEYLEEPLRIIPHQFVLTSYTEILDYGLIKSGYVVSILVTLLGTLLSVTLLVISAYPLSKPNLKGQKLVFSLIMFTMFFNGGMIPNYILIRDLGMRNTIWSLFVPNAMNVFNLILMKNFISITIPSSLEEAARIDGANDLRILGSVIVPLLKPAIATMIVFISVGLWNNYFQALMYISDRKLWPLTLVLREIVMEDNSPALAKAAAALDRSHPHTLRMAAIIITTLPIMVVYPFMQKYFVKGIMLGSVKG